MFRSTTSLVLLNVTVLDKDARPVPNLTADDFKVKLNGQERPVKLVNFLQVAAPPDATPTIPDATVDPHVTAVEAPRVTARQQRRIIVVMVDDLSLTPDRGRGMIAAAQKFIMSLPPTDLAGYATSSASSALSPTVDHLAVSTALGHVVGELNDPRDILGPPVGIDEAIQIADGNSALLDEVVTRDCGKTTATGSGNTCPDDVRRKADEEGRLAEGYSERQSRAFLSAVKALGPVPGLKHIVLISDGLALVERTQSAVALEPLSKIAAAAGVQVSVLNEEPDRANLKATDTSHAGAQTNLSGEINAQVKRSDDIALEQGVQTVADMTGGQFYRVIGTADSFFNRIASATSALYELGVEAPDKATPGKDYTLSVSVTKPGLSTRANHHAIMPEPAKPVPVETQLTDAIANGTALYAVPIAVGSSVRRGSESGQMIVDLDIDVPSSTAGPLQVVFGLADAIGIVKSGKKALDPPTGGGDYRTSLAVPVASGNYKIRLAVADAQGNVGSVETRVKAALKPMGPFQASDLMTGWAGQSGPAQFLALGKLPPGAVHLLGQLELYPTPGAALPSDVKVHMIISSADGTPLDDRTIAPTLESGVLRAQSVFDLQFIPPGAYVLKADVTAGGATLGTTTANVRVTGPGNPPRP
jgi:VWFA-related protein